MSGAETVAVLGVISSIIAIVDGTKQVYDAATNARGLPEAFREVAARLPIAQNILDSAKRHIEKGNTNEESCKAVKDIVEGCGEKAEKLKELFKKVIPGSSASRAERYLLAARTLGKGSRVENLMKGMLEDVQLLAINHSMTSLTNTQLKEVAEAIKELAALPPSIPEHAVEGTGFTAFHSGSGSINQAQRDLYTGSGPVYHAQSMAFGSNVGQKDDETQACLRALFLTDPRDDREKLVHTKGSRVDGTCVWIKSSTLYNSWLRSYSQLLWLSGGPGKGKTMLSLFLAEELERTANDSQNTTFLQYFCDNKERNTAVTIIRGLIFQLLQFRSKLFDYILPSFKIQKESLFTDSSFETLWRIFNTMIHDPVLGSIYCIIDGLDECNQFSLEVLLGKFKALFSLSNGPSHRLKLIVISRDLPEFIPRLLSNVPRIRLDPDADTEVNNDIQRFINAKVNELSAHNQYTEQLRAHVKKVFQDRAQGTFLWVGIVAQELRDYTVSEVQTFLEEIPSGLEELYTRMLLQIPIRRRETAAKILRWVVIVVRPLSVSELTAAIEPTIQNSTIISSEEVLRDQVLHFCGNFLTIKSGKVDLIHQSAKDYLLQESPVSNPALEIFRVKKQAGNLEVARKCLDYLQNGEIDLRRDTRPLKAFPLLSYAILHWPQHARSLSCSEEIFNLSRPFYHDKAQIKSWLKAYWYLIEPSAPPRLSTLLHVASFFGILPLAKNIILKEGQKSRISLLVCLYRRTGDGDTALHLAVQQGHKTTVQLLLKKGADIEARNIEGQTALHWAAMKECEAIIQLLLEKGSDIEARDNEGGTALNLAVRLELKAMSQLLLEKGANTEARDSKGRIVLHWAVMMGYEAMTQLLLEKGADIEARDIEGQTALHWAAMKGCEAIIQLLLEKGANIEARNIEGRTALHWAAMEGHEAVVQLLLEKGANIEARNIEEPTALHFAAQGGHKAVVQLLLEKGSDIEARDIEGQTALYWAAMEGHEAVVQLLLEKGANIEARNIEGQTALHWAAMEGHEAVVQLLLEKGSDIEARDIEGQTALHWVAMEGHEAVVQLLLEKGANIEARNIEEPTALHFAAQGGHKAVVQLLLEKGSDIEARDIEGQTALHWAAMEGHEAVVQLLLEKGADTKLMDSEGRTALYFAAQEGHEAVAQLLTPLI